MRYLFVLFLFLSSCSTNDVNVDENRIVPSEMDSLSNQTISQANSIKKVTLQSEEKENHSKIENKYGKQLDFCACIQFSDSLNNAAQKELSDQQIEKLLNRWDEMEIKCKEITSTNHRTPQERKSHEQKVKKCLTEK